MPNKPHYQPSSSPDDNSELLTLRALHRETALLRELIDIRFADVDKHILDKFTAQKEAATLALHSVEAATKVANDTARAAMARAEAATTKEYLESQIISLKEFLLHNIQATKEAISTAMAAADKAVTKAEMAAEKRFEGVNEFRAQLADQNQSFARKQEVDYRFAALEDKMNTAISALDVNKGRGLALSTVWAMGIGGLGVLIAAVTLINLVFSR